VLDQPHLRDALLPRLKYGDGSAIAAAVVRCAPVGGRLQHIWANEWAMAEAAMAPSPPSYLPIAQTVAAASRVYPTHWNRALEPWSAADNADELLPLAPSLHGTFLTRGLIVDGECVLSAAGRDAPLVPTPGAAEALKNYLQTSGRDTRLVLLLFPTRLFAARSADEGDNERAMAVDAAALRAAALDGVRALAASLPPGTQYRRSRSNAGRAA
jgi:hypothetical protein